MSRAMVDKQGTPAVPPVAQPKSSKEAAAAAAPPPPRRPSQRRPPTSDELIAYYSRNGLDRQAATEKALEDLQKALTIAVSRLPKGAKGADKSARFVSAGVDSLSRRLDAVESKLDTKPGISGVFAAGVAAGGFLQAVPHVWRAISQISQSMKEATSAKP